MNVHLTPSGLAVVLTGTMAVTTGAAAGLLSLVVLGAVLLAVATMSWRYALHVSRGMRWVQHEGWPGVYDPPTTIHLGELMEMPVQVSNPLPHALRRVRWEWPEQHGLALMTPQGWFRLPAGATVAQRIAVRGNHLGIWVIDGVRMDCEDPAGLVVSRSIVRLESRVRVVPQRREATLHGLQPMTEMSGALSVRAAGDGSDFRELREWQHGDSIRRVAWAATARRGSLVVRTFADERVRIRNVVVDASPSMREGQPSSRLDAAVEHAWQCVASWSQAHDLVAVSSFVERSLGGLPAGRGALHYQACSDHLLALGNVAHEAISDWVDEELAATMVLHLAARRHVEIRSADGSIHEATELVRTWLEQRYGHECDEMERRWTRAGFASQGRRLSRLVVCAGWPLPVRVDVRPAARENGLLAALIEAVRLPVGSETHIYSDIWESFVPERALDAIRLLVSRGRPVVLHVPLTYRFVLPVEGQPVQDAVYTVFAQDEIRRTRERLAVMKQSGAEVRSYAPPGPRSPAAVTPTDDGDAMARPNATR